ncbi:MAG: RHS repeat-associated core domain-containing protein, partial [Oscillospiraceae bacterium]|nr:RHS repeat-associated core domain-containing protein [Oscillospiraceae bacterium]
DWGNNTSVSIINGSNKITSSVGYSANGNFPVSATDALGNITRYNYNEDTGVLNWVQYPEDTEATRTVYTYDSMYRMASMELTTDTGLALSTEYTFENDLLTKLETPSTTYSFTYGDFALRSSVKVGTTTLASYDYTNDRNFYLEELAYGNGDSVQYEYDQQGRVTKQTYEDNSYVTYDYDNSGALATVYDSETGISTTYYYDFTDRMMKYVESGNGYSHSVGYEYDTINNLTQMVETVNGVAHTTGYTYDDDNRVTAITTDGITESYTYDAYGRITTKVTKNGDTTVLTETYTYKPGPNGTLTGQVATHKTEGVNYSVTYAYTYDDNGNITSVSDGTYTTTYAYDSANQLIRENNQQAGSTYTWVYDNAGNIQSKNQYAYTTGTVGTASDTVNYSYDNSQWGDLLTAYDGAAITYDQIGNPLSDGTRSYTWKQGHQLATLSNGASTWTNTYNADGLRTKRTNGTSTYSYVYNGSQLVQMTVDGNTLYFTYDASGTPQTVTYNGTTYYYATNLQGDITAILDNTGTTVVSYTYDAWGSHTSGNNGIGTLASTLGQHNPLRYRGYVYDVESELYYLQSRYYNPAIGRFINADVLIATGQGILGNNMFAYCLCNPVNGCDPCGTCFHRLDFWNDCEKCGGKTAEDKWNNLVVWCTDAYNRIISINQQQDMLKMQIIARQNEMIADAGNAMWEAYKHSNELQVQQKYQHDMAVKAFWEDTFSSPSRLGDFASMTFTNATAYAGYATLATATTVTTGGVVVVALTIAFAIRSTLQYYNLLPEISWEDLVG